MIIFEDYQQITALLIQMFDGLLDTHYCCNETTFPLWKRSIDGNFQMHLRKNIAPFVNTAIRGAFAQAVSEKGVSTSFVRSGQKFGFLIYGSADPETYIAGIKTTYDYIPSQLIANGRNATQTLTAEDAAHVNKLQQNFAATSDFSEKNAILHQIIDRLAHPTNPEEDTQQNSTTCSIS
ncbi:MAG: hypothetical protein NXI01_02155 [Gammaproteobacteria bacterium]|nr:hypothetical protein [Gammaproteobacteria bacterium]